MDAKLTKNEIALGLGYYGAVRLRLGPDVVLNPDQTAVKVDKVSLSPFALKGTCENLLEKVSCRLDWVVKTDVFAHSVTGHPRATVIVPNGNNYEIREVVDGTEQNLSLDIFDIGIIGTGKLGYTLRLDMMGKPEFEITPDASPITIDIPIAVSLAKAVVQETSDESIHTEEEDQASSSGTATTTSSSPTSSTPTQPTPSTGPIELQVGTIIDATTNISPVLKDCNVKLMLAETSGKTGDELLPDTGQTLTWTVANAAPEGLQFRAGMKSGPREPTPGVTYYQKYVPDGVHCYAWQLVITRPPPPAGSQPPKRVESLATPVQHVATMKHPKLESFELSLDGDGNFAVVGAFSGFDPHYGFGLELDTHVMFKEGEKTRNVPLTKMLADEHSSARLTTRADVAMGAFSATIVALADIEGALVGHVETPKLFAVIHFSPRWIGRDAYVSFLRLASYAPNIESTEGNTGFAPFGTDDFEPPVVASGVCSNLYDLQTKQAAPLKAPVLAVPDARLPDYKWFLACVVGEALGCTDDALRGVAHSIINRMRHREWSACESAEAVVKYKKAYESYRDKQGNMSTNFKTGLSYYAKKYTEHESTATMDADGKIDNIERVVIPIFLKKTGDNHEFVTFFYSPNTQNGRHDPPPDWASSAQLMEITSLILPATAAPAPVSPRIGTNRDFKFYRYRGDVPTHQ